jgi:hypothetical protein
MCVAPLSLVSALSKFEKNILAEMVKIVAEMDNNFIGGAEMTI